MVKGLKFFYLLGFCSLSFLSPSYADTMEHYMHIASDIPKMEIKADSQAQVWAKSARNVLVLTCESIGESLTLANRLAEQKGSPLFCLPEHIALSGQMLHDMVQKTYDEINVQGRDKSQMTVSEVALIGLSKNYPCTAKKLQPSISIKHVHGIH